MNSVFNKKVGVLVLLILGAILAISPAGTKNSKVVSTDELAGKLLSKSHHISAEDLAHYLIDKQPGLHIVDVRTAGEFEKYHLPGAINVPLDQIVYPEKLDEIDPEQTIVLYSNGDAHASQAWLLLQQKGIASYVLTGGLNYWSEAILNPNPPSDLVADSEILRYQFRKAASGYFNAGGAIEEADEKTEIEKPKKTIKFKRKKKLDEGC